MTKAMILRCLRNSSFFIGRRNKDTPLPTVTIRLKRTVKSKEVKNDNYMELGYVPRLRLTTNLYREWKMKGENWKGDEN